jgi:hypothetical protein
MTLVSLSSSASTRTPEDDLLRDPPKPFASQAPLAVSDDVKQKQLAMLPESQIAEIEYAEFMAMDDPMLFIYRLWRIKQQLAVDTDNLLHQFKMEVDALPQHLRRDIRHTAGIKLQYRRKYVERSLEYHLQMAEWDPKLIDRKYCDEMDAKISRFLLRWHERNPTSAASASLQNVVAIQSSSAPVAADAGSVSDYTQSILILPPVSVVDRGGGEPVTHGISNFVQPSAPVFDRGDVESVTPGLRKRRRALFQHVSVGSLTMFQIDFHVSALNPEVEFFFFFFFFFFF